MNSPVLKDVIAISGFITALILSVGGIILAAGDQGIWLYRL
jgi:hypothetical protein